MGKKACMKILRDELRKLNDKIDRYICQGRSWKKEALAHKRLRSLLS